MLKEVIEHVPRACGLEPWEEPRLVRLAHIPSETEKPVLVLALCRPFVLVETCGESRQTLDTRRCVLARVCPDFARAAGCKKKLPSDKAGGKKSRK